MQNVKNYLQTLWKSSSSSSISRSRILTLPPSLIHFTDSTLADLQQSEIDEKLLNEISRKLIESVIPPKLQICRHGNHWFALNNSHLLVYRQLERIGLCETVVCDVVRNEDIPLGIRQSLFPSSVNNGNEVMYCSGVQADSCGYFDDLTDDDDDEDDDDEEEEEEEESDSMAISVLSDHRFDQIDDDDREADEDNDDESQLFLTMS